MTISIITVVFNGEQFLEKTIKSVVNQTYSQHIEYIVVDGKSTDKTLEIIHKYQKSISKWISEPDKGLYFAMNKAINLATGDYLWFMNAGDTFPSSQTVENAFASQPNADIYYGEASIVNNEGKTIADFQHKNPKKLTHKSLQTGMVVCHQAFVVKRNIAPKYNTDYRICADIDWVIHCLKNAKTICNTHQTLALFLENGLSSQKFELAWKERFLILQHHYGFWTNIANHLYIVVRFIYRKIKN